MVTMKDVALRAQVSLSTVSYVMSGTRPVGEETSTRVREAMAELGYRPNAAARSLASRRSRVLALVYPLSKRGLGGTISEFVDAANLAARDHGYHLVLWPLRAEQAGEIVELAQQGMADGVLVMEVSLDDVRVEKLQAAGIPTTMIGRTRELAGRSWVDVDFDGTIDHAVQHLAGLGHTRIAFVNHSQASVDVEYAPTFRAGDAYAAAMARHGLAPLALHCDDSPSAGRAAAAELLHRAPDLTAVVTMNELATFGVLAELQSRGLDVPGDISILSVVSSPGVSEMSHPPLTTMHAPGAELGRLAVLRLLSELGEPVRDGEPNLIRCTYVEGSTVAAVREHRP